MKIIPAIDLHEGKAVQLVGGDFNNQKITVEDVFSLANKFISTGIKRLHIIDLDAAKNVGSNKNLILDLLKRHKLPIEVGGGIRTIELAKEYLDSGAEFVIVGTQAVTNPDFLKELSRTTNKNKIIVCLDYKNGKIVTHGWDIATETSPIDFGKLIEEYCGGFLLTCVDKEGQLKGPDVEYIARARRELKGEIIASGGISSEDDLINLQNAGASGAVIGMALYTGKINLENALKIQKD
jgi:phosphoribosylformimino-5-aminoimidazole carboxamide ribotide isomerase